MSWTSPSKELWQGSWVRVSGAMLWSGGWPMLQHRRQRSSLLRGSLLPPPFFSSQNPLMGAPSNQRIKIIHVLHSFDIGGLENGVVNLINFLDWERYSHVLCCLTTAGRMVQRLRRRDVEVIELNKEPG